MSTIAERIMLIRGKTSRRAFAGTLGIQESTLRNYENGVSLPNSDLIASICQILRINPDWLLFGTGSIRAGESSQPQEKKEEIPSQTPSCLRCTKLEEKLERVEAQRDELAQENRQLLHKISDLRVENAIQKEQLRVASGKSVVADIA